MNMPKAGMNVSKAGMNLWRPGKIHHNHATIWNNMWPTVAVCDFKNELSASDTNLCTRN